MDNEIPVLKTDADDNTEPKISELPDWDHNVYDSLPAIQNVDSNGQPANNCPTISSITVLLQIDSIRKLICRKAEAAERNITPGTLREGFCQGIRDICRRKTNELLNDSMTRGKQLNNLCMHQLALGSAGANTVKTFRKIIQRIPFAETLFGSTSGAYSIMKPSNSLKKSLCPAYGGVAKENLVGWLEAVDAEQFQKGLTLHKDPYYFMDNWKNLNHTVAWIKNSDDTFEIISNEMHAQMIPHEKVNLEMVVMKNDQANRSPN